MRRLFLHSMVILGWSLATGCSASNSNAEQPSGPVLDRAEIIPPEIEARLDRELRDYHEHTGRTLVVVTTPSLNGKSIDAYSLKLANQLGIGDRERDDGLMLLIAPNERKVRIEVGLGLEKVVTNQIAADILRESVIPRFGQSDMTGGIDEGVDALIATTECRMADGIAALCPEKATK